MSKTVKEQIQELLTKAGLPLEYVDDMILLKEIYDAAGHSGASHEIFIAMLGDSPRPLENFEESNPEDEIIAYQLAFYDLYPEDEQKRTELYRIMRKFLNGDPLKPMGPDEVEWIPFKHSISKKGQTYLTKDISGLYKEVLANGTVRYIYHGNAHEGVFDTTSRTMSCSSTCVFFDDPEDIRLIPHAFFKKHPNQYFLHDSRNLPMVSFEGDTEEQYMQLNLFLFSMLGVQPFTWEINDWAFSMSKGRVSLLLDHFKKEVFEPGIHTEKKKQELYLRVTESYYILEGSSTYEGDLLPDEMLLYRRFATLLLGWLKVGKHYDNLDFIRPFQYYVNDRYYTKFDKLLIEGEECWTIGAVRGNIELMDERRLMNECTIPIERVKFLTPTGKSEKYILFNNIDWLDWLHSKRIEFGIRHPKRKSEGTKACESESPVDSDTI